MRKPCSQCKGTGKDGADAWGRCGCCHGKGFHDWVEPTHFFQVHAQRLRHLVAIFSGLKELFAAFAGVAFAFGHFPEAIAAVGVCLGVAYLEEYLKPYWRENEIPANSL